MASCLSVLRFASSKDNEESLKLLMSRIDDHFGKNADAPEVPPKNEDTGTTITISNRYFSANVSLEFVPDETSEQRVLSNSSNVAMKEDGIVLVVDASQASDLASTLDAHHDRAIAAGGGDLLRLCVALGEPDCRQMTPKQIEEDYSRRILWCLDRGYEYIASCDLSDDGVLQGHDERDKEGFARLVEAIQGTVWSSAIMEKQKGKQLQASYVEVRTPNQKASCSGADQCDTHEDTANNYEPPDPSQLPPLTANFGPSKEEDKEREEKARKALLGQTNQQGGDIEGQHHEEARNEHLMDEFEGALKQASRIRDMSHSGQLSDDERRQRAGDAAVLLMDLLGKMGYDEDGESDEEVQQGTDFEGEK